MAHSISVCDLVAEANFATPSNIFGVCEMNHETARYQFYIFPVVRIGNVRLQYNAGRSKQ